MSHLKTFHWSIPSVTLDGQLKIAENSRKATMRSPPEILLLRLYFWIPLMISMGSLRVEGADSIDPHGLTILPDSDMLRAKYVVWTKGESDYLDLHRRATQDYAEMSHIILKVDVSTLLGRSPGCCRTPRRRFRPPICLLS